MSPNLRCHEYLRLLPRAPVASFSVALRLPDSLTVPLGHASSGGRFGVFFSYRLIHL
jgi:hypothetical protein